MKHHLLPLLSACVVLVAPARAASKADVDSHCNSYHAAAKAVIEMAINKKVDAAIVEQKVNVMLADAVWLAREYAAARPKGDKLLKVIVANVDAMKKLSFKELEEQWHDLGYFAQPGHEAGLDLKAEENEHFTDPIHTIVHPLLVLKAAQAYAAGQKAEDLAAVKEEMEEGIEQMEKQRALLSKS